MKKVASRGVTALIVSQCLVKVLGLLYKLYLANKDGFGDTGNAIYNSGFQIYALLLTISSIGVPNAVAKIVAEKNYLGDKKKVGNILKTAIVLFSFVGISFSIALAVIAGGISSKLLNMEEAKFVIIALSPAIFNVCIISVYRGFYNGTNNIQITAKSQTIEQIYKTIFTILLVEIFYYISGKCTVVMAVVANFATTLATLSSLIYLWRKCELRINNYKVSLKVAKNILKLSIPISMSAILSSLNRIIDSATIVRFLKKSIGELNARIHYGILSGKVEVLANVPVSFIISIATTLIPTISCYNAKNDIKSVADLFKLYLLYTNIVILPCCAVMFCFSEDIMMFLFSNSNGSELLKISAISMLFISFEQIIHATLQGIGKVIIPAISLGVGVIIKVTLNILLLNIDGSFLFGGINGACFSTLICHMVACSISFSVLKWNIKLNIDYIKYVVKPVIATIFMIITAIFLKFFLLGILRPKMVTILIVCTAVSTYLLAIWPLKVFNKKELQLIPFLSNFINFAKK